ncbi:uncharacterized protein LOC134541286 isoform X1 [Bacillus rossius redtenbacheri]
MAASFSARWALCLLVLTAQRCHGDDKDLRADRDVALFAAMGQVGQSLDCLRDVMLQGLQLQEKKDVALAGLLGLPALVQEVKDQLSQQNGGIEGVKKEVADLHRVDALTQEIEDLKMQVATLTQENEDLKGNITIKDQMLITHTQEIADLKTQEMKKDQMVATLTQENTALKTQAVQKDRMVATLTAENTNLKAAETRRAQAAVWQAVTQPTVTEEYRMPSIQDLLGPGVRLGGIIRSTGRG